jgi:hypothetical protein
MGLQLVPCPRPRDADKGQVAHPRYCPPDECARQICIPAGQLSLGADASFELDLADKLPAGAFTLAAQIIVNANAMNAEIRRFPIDVAPKP